MQSDYNEENTQLYKLKMKVCDLIFGMAEGLHPLHFCTIVCTILKKITHKKNWSMIGWLAGWLAS